MYSLLKGEYGSGGGSPGNSGKSVVLVLPWIFVRTISLSAGSCFGTPTPTTSFWLLKLVIAASLSRGKGPPPPVSVTESPQPTWVSRGQAAGPWIMSCASDAWHWGGTVVSMTASDGAWRANRLRVCGFRRG